MARYVNIDNLQYTSYPLDGGFVDTTFVTKEELEAHAISDCVRVVHGHWSWETDKDMPDPTFKLFICSNCHAKTGHPGLYCGNCGAKMSGRAELDGIRVKFEGDWL